MEIIKAKSPLDFENYANECLKGHEGTVIYVHKENCVWSGLLKNTYDEEECKKRGLTVCFGRYYAGSIVNMPNDISVCITTWGKCDKGFEICKAVMELLKKQDIDVFFDVNDVIADGKKVASYCSVQQPSGWVQTVVHISIGEMNLDLVKAICTKPIKKIPGALSDYGIKTKDILKIVEKIIC